MLYFLQEVKKNGLRKSGAADPYPAAGARPEAGRACRGALRQPQNGFKMGKRVQLVKQYPEWDLQVRIERRGRGILLWHSAKEGLLYQLI